MDGGRPAGPPRRSRRQRCEAGTSRLQRAHPPRRRPRGPARRRARRLRRARRARDRPNADATLLLDFTPNAVHAGIYTAVARGFDDAEGVSLRIREPGASTDALALLQAGRADLAILDIHDLGPRPPAGTRPGRGDGARAAAARGRARAAGGPDAARRSRAAAPASPGLPSDEAVLRSVVAGAGGDPAPGAGDDDRLPGGAGAAGRPRGGRDRVLERRGRRAAGASGPDSASSASTSTARRPTRSSCCP